jgi:hypothetical protein
VINELHAGITLKPLSNDLRFWDDFVDPKWRVTKLAKPAMDLREVLLGDSRVPEQVAWAVLHVRQLLKKTDLSSLLNVFDPREGYCMSSLLSTMSAFFTPKFDGDMVDAVISLRNPFRANVYTHAVFFFVGTSTTLTIQRSNTPDVTSPWDGDSATVFLPGTNNTITLRKFEGSGRLLWSALPNWSVPNVAKALVLNENIVREVGALPSVYGPGTLANLVNVALDTKDAVAQFAAAGALIAGVAVYDSKKV